LQIKLQCTGELPVLLCVTQQDGKASDAIQADDSAASGGPCCAYCYCYCAVVL
jgi:hypothetical protein